jgi:hypothetical protein
MDFAPGELPDEIPKTIWVKWDSLGEYMDTTDDPKYGTLWLKEAEEGYGFTATYTLHEKSGV